MTGTSNKTKLGKWDLLKLKAAAQLTKQQSKTAFWEIEELRQTIHLPKA